MSEKLRQFILFSGDIILLHVALFFALCLRYRALVDPSIWQEHWFSFSSIFVIWVVVFYIAGFYTLTNIRNDLKFYVSASQILGINILLAITFFYLQPGVLTPKTILLLTSLIFFGLFVIWRRLAHRYISSLALKRRVLIIGNNISVQELTKLLDLNPQLGYEIAAILSHEPRNEIGNVPDYRNPQELEIIVKKHHINTIVMDNRSRESKALIDNLFQYLPRRIEFISLSRFYENITKRISLETIDQFWFLENLQEGSKRLYDLGKRAVDIVAALAAGIISLPLLPFICLIIVITQNRPIFFSQERLGKNGRPFRAIKLRTMVRDAEKNGPQWASRNDPRVTAFGGFLRKTRLDEIPQLWNIVRGEMSFVGPRPERPEFVADLEKTIPFYRERLLVKPGLTGWAQINFPYGASTRDAVIKLQYDLYYVKNRSLILDLAIILRTIKTVLSAGGR